MKKTLNTALEWFMITFGTAVIAAAVYFFMMPSGVSIGSVSGMAIILAHFLPLPVSAITMFFNAGLLLLGFLFIGREFGVKTVYTSLLLPVMIGVCERFFPQQVSPTGDAFQDMICYLFVVSLGQAILFKRNASSGGLDIVGKFLNKFLHIELGKGIAMVGMCVALSSVFVSEIKLVVLSVLGTYLSGIVLDHFIFGFNIKRRVCIISKKEAEIRRFILHDLHSGATIYEATGAYDNKPHSEIIAIVDKNEYTKLISFLEKCDPAAFVTVYNVNEVFYRPKV